MIRHNRALLAVIEAIDSVQNDIVIESSDGKDGVAIIVTGVKNLSRQEEDQKENEGKNVPGYSWDITVRVMLHSGKT